MMYRCENCGHLFEEGEQAVWEERHGLDTPPYEKWDGCPLCRGSYEQVYQCKECGEWHEEGYIFEGVCESCLIESVNYESFFEYCEAHKKDGHLDSFVMMFFFDMDAPRFPTKEFHDLMIREYRERVDRVKSEKMIFGKSFNEFITDCITFVAEDYSEYAEWLNKREVK